MKQFVLKSLLFAIPIALLLGWFEFNLSCIPNSYTKKHTGLTHGLADWEVLVLGSSHAEKGINPACFDRNGFNMACSSQSLYYDAEIAARFIRQMPRLKLVILPISYFSLEYDASRHPENWRACFYQRFYHIPASSWRLRWDIRNVSLLAAYGQKECLRYLRAWFHIDLAPTVHNNGWMSARYDPSQNEIGDHQGLVRVRYHESFMNERNLAANTGYVRRIIDLCNRQKVIPVLITTPVYQTYSDHLDPAKYNRMQKQIQRLCTESNSQYFNFLQDPRFARADFQDNDHLNAQGAEKFSRLVNAEILMPLLPPSAASPRGKNHQLVRRNEMP